MGNVTHQATGMKLVTTFSGDTIDVASENIVHTDWAFHRVILFYINFRICDCVWFGVFIDFIK
jgi:hypothetical protein